MSTFTSPFTELDIEFLDGRDYVLLKEFEYHVGSKTSTEVIQVPAGFHTDFASVPRALWDFISPVGGKYARGSVIHDYLYRVGWPSPLGKRYTRLESDNIFFEAMQVLGTPWLERWVIWLGVRLGGGPSYRTQNPTKS